MALLSSMMVECSCLCEGLVGLRIHPIVTGSVALSSTSALRAKTQEVKVKVKVNHNRTSNKEPHLGF